MTLNRDENDVQARGHPVVLRMNEKFSFLAPEFHSTITKAQLDGYRVSIFRIANRKSRDCRLQIPREKKTKRKPGEERSFVLREAFRAFRCEQEYFPSPPTHFFFVSPRNDNNDDDDV